MVGLWAWLPWRVSQGPIACAGEILRLAPLASIGKDKCGFREKYLEGSALEGFGAELAVCCRREMLCAEAMVLG